MRRALPCHRKVLLDGKVTGFVFAADKVRLPRFCSFSGCVGGHESNHQTDSGLVGGVPRRPMDGPEMVHADLTRAHDVGLSGR